MNRPFNFGAGPSTMPETVLARAASEMLNWPNENGKLSGMSVMEMSHRSKEFLSIYHHAIQNLRNLLQIPPHYKILFLQGGALLENAVVPLNLCASSQEKAAFVITGAWSNKSLKQAQQYCQATSIASGETELGYTSIPDVASWRIPTDARYLHICSNETIHGVEFQSLPDLNKMNSDAVLVMDASSHMASRPIDWRRVGFCFAGAQKNLGPAGLTIVVVREDLLGRAQSICPEVLNYQMQAGNDSMLNTPPTYAIYMAGLMFEWILEQGGVDEMERRAKARSDLLYKVIDESNLYQNFVDKSCRSRMNVPFFLKDTSLTEVFLTGATQKNLLGLKGHKSVGGLRASLYNAMPLAGVESLVQYMCDFEKRIG